MSRFFLVMAAVSAGVLLIVAARLLIAGRAPSGDGRLPLTPLEKRAWIGLGMGAVTLAASAAVFAFRGLKLYDTDPATRFAIYGLLLLGVSTQWLVTPWRPGGRLRPWVDERDLRTLERAPAYQALSVIVSLAIWAVALTETYKTTGSIPIVFPSLIFLSSVLVHSVTLSLGILLGSRRGLLDAEG